MYDTDNMAIKFINNTHCSPAEIKKSMVAKTTESDPVLKTRHSTLRRRRRRITFNEEVAVREIEHVNSFTIEDTSNIWYKKAEYTMMRSEAIATIRKMVKGRYTSDNEHQSSRGLENRSPKDSIARKLKKLNALVSVLDEQERQFFADCVDDEASADVYIKATSGCRRDAIRRGEQDAQEATRIYAEEGLGQMLIWG